MPYRLASPPEPEPVGSADGGGGGRLVIDDRPLVAEPPPPPPFTFVIESETSLLVDARSASSVVQLHHDDADARRMLVLALGLAGAPGWVAGAALDRVAEGWRFTRR